MQAGGAGAEVCSLQWQAVVMNPVRTEKCSRCEKAFRSQAEEVQCGSAGSKVAGLPRVQAGGGRNGNSPSSPRQGLPVAQVPGRSSSPLCPL